MTWQPEIDEIRQREALAHAAFNAQAGFGVLLLSSADSLLRAPIGLIGLVPMLLFAIGLAVTGRLKAERQSPNNA